MTGGSLADLPTEPISVLRGIYQRHPDGRPAALAQPLTPLIDTTLLTNPPGEPNLWSQLQSEIDSADSIDLVMAFIRRSGIPHSDRRSNGTAVVDGEIRVLTTTYTGSTEAAALDVLTDLGADVRVSYDIGATRLHAKAWIFHRDSGLTTAFVGSSNLTYSAQVTGLEWKSVRPPLGTQTSSSSSPRCSTAIGRAAISSRTTATL